jgi:hypothetical protein
MLLVVVMVMLVVLVMLVMLVFDLLLLYMLLILINILLNFGFCIYALILNIYLRSRLGIIIGEF